MRLVDKVDKIEKAQSSSAAGARAQLPGMRAIVGVACTGMYISDMSKGLAGTFTDFEEHGVYVREASSGLLVATSASATSGSSMQAYYDTTAGSRILPTASPDKLIRWSATELIKNNSGTCGNWPCDGTTFVKWVNNSYESTVPGLTSVHKGDAFYINTQDFKQNGLSWQVIAVQKVDCPVGYEVDTEKFVCKECISPASSAGGSSQCTLCIQGYYYNKAHQRCETCPPHAICEGGSALPYPEKGYWMDTSKEEYLADGGMCCSREFDFDGDGGQATCVISENCQGGADYFDLCFSSPERLEMCNTKGHLNYTSTEKMMCGEGASGHLCDICVSPNYYNNDGECQDCEGNVGPLIAIMCAFAAGVVIAFIVYHKYGDYIMANYPLIIGAIFDTGRMKVAFANIQIIGSVSWSTGVNWPMPFSIVSKLGSILEFNFIDVLPLSCMPGPGYSFYAYVITNTAGPLFFNAFLFFLMESEKKVGNSNQPQVRKRGFCSSYLGNPNFMWFAILMIFYIFLPSSTLALVRIFHCTDFPDGSSWLDADLALQCTEKNGGPMTAGHLSMVVYAVIMLIIWAIGVPALFFVLLARHHKTIVNYDKEQDTMECPDELEPLKFLFFHYKPENYNAEWKECARRILLMGGVAILPSTSAENANAEKAFAGTIIALFFAVWDRERAPWDDPFTNTLMNGFDWVVYFVFLGAFSILSGKVDQTAISYVLFFLSSGVFAAAAKFQYQDFKRNTELLQLKGQIADFRESVVGIAFVKRTMRGFERQRFLKGDWAMDISDMNQEQRLALIKQTSTDLAHLRDDTEIDNFLEVQKHFYATGERTDWFWQEEAHHSSRWDPEVIHPDENLLKNENKIWVQYSPAVTAQLEKVYLDTKKGLKVDPVVAVDLEGRVVGTDSHAGANGLRYSVDTKRMMQINAKTGYVSKQRTVHLTKCNLFDPVPIFSCARRYERPCLRVQTEIEKKEFEVEATKEVKKNIDLVDINSFTNRDGPGTAVTLNAAKLDAREIDEDRMPPYPLDLIEADEPLLLIQKGQLIQIQKKRDDGWMYGFVVWEPEALDDAKRDDRPTRVMLSKKLAREKKGEIEMQEGANLGVNAEDMEWSGVDAQEHKSKGDDDLGGEHSGWFPSIFVRPPQMQELKAMQDAMGGSENAIDFLAPPEYWSEDSKSGKSMDAKIIGLNKKTDEFNRIKSDFLRRLGSRSGDIKQIVTISRIENLALWQSYAAKKATLLQRAEKEQVDSSNYEKPMMYHGTHPEVIPKIAQQGFNRAFCGRNAVRFGKGVYFALTSNYSHNYASADSRGVKRMFVCRVLPGETSQGRNEQIVPEVRIQSNFTNYDSTTDQVDCPEPSDADPGKYGTGVRQMYVVYHDAQAYPEYLIEYKS